MGLTRAMSLNSRVITSAIKVEELDFDVVTESSSTVEGYRFRWVGKCGSGNSPLIGYIGRPYCRVIQILYDWIFFLYDDHQVICRESWEALGGL